MVTHKIVYDGDLSLNWNLRPIHFSYLHLYDEQHSTPALVVVCYIIDLLTARNDSKYKLN